MNKILSGRRAIIVVIDSMGVGALEDCADYNDEPTCNTLCNTAKAVNGLKVPILEKMGLGNITPIEGVEPVDEPIASYGILKMKSKGKDTTTGHWEIAGIVLDEPFKTYKEFPDELIGEFIEKTKCGGILGNYAASGTKIIEDLHKEHASTKYPIIYTSADSVFQIAVDIDVIPLETLYKWCEIARKILDDGWGISRVIARPYQIIDGKPTRISKFRHDYSTLPPEGTLLDVVEKAGGKVLGIGKIEDIFVKKGVTEAIHTGSNLEGLKVTLDSLDKNYDLIFTNLVDTDMLYGHRRDAQGYAKAIEEIDGYLGQMIKKLGDDDMLIITADHGCDPTACGTDHTREMVPVIIYGKNIKPEEIGVKESFTYITDRIKKWLEI
jgi:phosphopentomutase